MTDNERQFVDEILARSTGCPEAEQLEAYDAKTLDAGPRKRIEDHASACEACTAALNFLAREPDEQATPEEVVRRSEEWIGNARSQVSPKGTLSRWPWIAAAAAAIFAVMLLLPPGEETGAPELRATDGDAVVSLLPDRPLPREDCRLRWSEGPEGSTYRLTVFTEDLRTLATWEDLRVAEHVVPAAVLERVESTLFVWRVEVFPPAAEARLSATFTAELEER